MLNISDLRIKQTHPAKKLFTSYSKIKCADIVGCSPGHFVNVLNGNMKPSSKLNAKILALADEIQQQEGRS